MQISNTTRLICGIILIMIPTIEFGGVFLLKMLRTREPGYMDNPLRQNLFRAGHAHAGVIVILSLICEMLVDSIILPPPFAAIVREREVDSVVGPIAIVVGPGVIAQQARAFSERGHLIRPIRVFAELHEARRWLDQQRDKTVDPRSAGASVVPPLKID